MNLKKNPLILNMVFFFRKLFGITPEKLDYQFHLKRRINLIQNYFKENEIKKLQIGSQSHPLLGWLNVDLAPKNIETVLMDATKPFPFQNNSFDYVFSEHMIEHIAFEEGLFMLKECFREIGRAHV